MFQKIHDSNNFEDIEIKNESNFNESKLNLEDFRPLLNETVQINDQYFNVKENSGEICLEKLEVISTFEDIQKNLNQYINQTVTLDDKMYSVKLNKFGDISIEETQNLTQYPCPNCPKTFSNASALTKHYKELHKEKIFVCRQCPRIFLELSDLFLHARRDHVDPNKPPRDPSQYRYHCRFPNCDYMTNNGGTFEHHCGAHTKIKPYKCQYCHKTFTQKTNRNTHESRHNDEKKFDCLLCKKKFKTHDIYLSHLRTREHELQEHAVQMNNESLKIICLGCNERFSNVYHVRNHRKVCNLELEKNFKCESCGLLIVDVKELRQHLKEHAVNFSCPICNKPGFEQMNKLNHHITRNHGRKVNRKEVCRYCEVTFSSTEELQTHVQQYHKDEINTRKSRGATGKIVCPYDECGFTANTVMHMKCHIEKHEKGTLEQVKHEPMKRGRKRKLPDARDLFNGLFDGEGGGGAAGGGAAAGGAGEHNKSTGGIIDNLTESVKRKRGRPRKTENYNNYFSQENVCKEEESCNNNNNNQSIFYGYQQEVKKEQKEFDQEL